MKFNREFKIWDYWVSHSQLLLRSPGDLRYPVGSSESRNIDIRFSGVGYIDLPAVMHDLEIVDSILNDQSMAEARLGRTLMGEQVFVLISSGRRHLVVATVMVPPYENDHELMISTLERTR